MKWKDLMQAIKDYRHPNTYELKPYLVMDGKKHPFAVICPGGGYGMVSNHGEGTPFAMELNKRGYSAFVVYYRVREKARFPAPQDDLARAVREIFDHAEEWNLDTAHYSVWGSSAGGHLAASFGTESMGYKKYGLPRPEALVLIYPVITMGEKTHLPSRNYLLGKSADPAMIEKTSVEKQVTAAYPPTFAWCGEADDVVPPDNSRMLCRALAEKGVPYEFVTYPNVGHGTGLGIGMGCEGWFERAVAFWQKQ